MLFAETSAGMHKPVLLPAVCWYLAFSPQLWSAGNESKEHAEWPLRFLKMHIISTYFMAGLGKIVVTLRQGKWNWADGTNMQQYLYIAMWARPGPHQSALPRLRWFVTRPWACVLLGLVGGLVFECGCPVPMFLGGYSNIFLFTVAVQFHYGVFYLQGIDFTSQWVPCLLVFLLDRTPILSLNDLLPAAGLEASWVELVCWIFACMHLLGQLFCAFTFREVTHSGDKGGIPFSCLHMFTVNSNIFGGDFCSWYTLMEGDQRATGHLGITEWSGPVFTDFHGHTMCNHKFLLRFVKECDQQKPFLCFSNFNMGDDLKEALEEVCRFAGPKTDARFIRDPDTLVGLVEVQRRAQVAFYKDVARNNR